MAKGRLHNLLVAAFMVVGVAKPMTVGAEEPRVTLRAGVLDFYPFGYDGPGDEVLGLSVDLFEIVLERSGMNLQAELLPVPRALSAAARGEVDLLYSYKAEDMIAGVDFLGNVGCLTSLIVPRAGVEITSLDEMGDLRIGYVAAGYFAIRFVPRYPMIGFPLPSNETMFRMLVRGKVDAIVVNDGVLFSYLQRNPEEAKLPADWQQLIGKPFVLETLETHISISENSPLYIHRDRLQSAILETAAAGEVAQIYREWGVPHGGSCDNEEVRRALQ